MIDFPYPVVKNPSAIITIGIPGCGKTRYATELSQILKCPIVSPDELREALLGDARDQRFNSLVWNAAKAMVDVCIKSGRTVIVDAMYIEPEYRRQDAAYFKSLGAKQVLAIVFTTPLEVCLSRNAHRDRRVDPKVIADLHRHLTQHPPVEAEGFEAVLRVSS